FLTELTTYCEHCLNLLYPSQDRFYSCQQCPNGFGVCMKCVNLMKTEHAPQHSFNKGNYSVDESMLIHYITTCNGCKAEKFKGIRYHCDECREGYDLCESCYQNASQLHPNHAFKIAPAPLLKFKNYILLAKRAIEVCKRFPDLQYDPLTGYSLKDAEQVKEKEEKNLTFYRQQIEQLAIAVAKGRQQLLDARRARTQDILSRLNPQYHVMQMRPF
ncbi:unnamed protein product, partial [Rotaria sp. Silwood2]